jgi:hypothetical protein
MLFHLIRDAGAIEPKAKRAPKGGGPFLGGRGFLFRASRAKPICPRREAGRGQAEGPGKYEVSLLSKTSFTAIIDVIIAEL